MLVLRRRIIFAASEILLHLPWWKRWWFRLTVFWIGRAVPVGNGSAKLLSDALAKEKSIGLFLQGDIHPALKNNRIRTGAVVLSHQLQIPIVPMHISGSGRLWPIINWPLRLWRFRSVSVTVGKPILPPDHIQTRSREDYQQEANELFALIARLG